MHLITIDLEDWFHILNNSCTKSHAQWEMYENRIHRNTKRIIDALNKQGHKATFFCLGWIAEKYPEVIREIVNHGHEIGSHTHYHQLLYEQKSDEFREDLIASIKTLEDTSGKKVKYFRAPGFSITENNKWVFDILVERGIEIDCSIFPALRAHGGFPTYTYPGPSIIKYNGISIKELPVSYKNVFGIPVIFSGGGYFRLLPYRIIKALTKRSDYVMLYFHPRDFDPDQPMIPGLSPIRKFKSYYGLQSAMPKFERWLNDFHCVDITTADKMIDWSSVPVVEL
jgi:peptidoglycan-N-acetylglucosamine deacetylase